MSNFARTILSIIFIGLFISPVAHGKTLKIATLSPDGSFWMKQMRAGAEEIATKTEGRVKLKFYPGGIMGDDKAVLRKIRIGQLHGGAIAGGSLAKFYKDSQIYNLPLTFKNYKEVDFVRQKLDQKIMDGFEDAGFVTFGLAEGGFAYAMGKAPMTQVESLDQFKIWVPSDDKASLVITQAYDISPIPLSMADVLPALQTGIIDAVATSPIAAIALQWHTQISHLTDIPLMYFYAVLAINKKSFDKLSESDQQIMREVMGEIFHTIDKQNRSDNVAAFTALQSQGIQLAEPNENELSTWYTKAENAGQKLVTSGELSQEIVDEFNGYLSAYRNRQAMANQ